MLHFLSDGKVIPELERSARLDDSILRFLTVLADDDVTDVEARRGEAVDVRGRAQEARGREAVRDAEEAARAARRGRAAG